ncbi:hypothetical protein PDIDSM_6912 [Penicillium digitatum]|nr:hypothetical protein PDIDSM_6912 [Penicillium digitatum]
MAPPITENPEFEDSDVSDNSDVEQADVDDRAPKRRRLSESSNDSYVAPAPLPTLSRIKKKGEVEAEPESKEEETVLISDAIELGKKSGLSTFAELDVAPWLVSSLTAMAIKRPTAIQKACIPEILKGKDCIGGSRTGSGKTMAFAVPIMQQWPRNPFGIYALVLTPTRELALQIYEQFRAVSAPQNMKPILVVGGVDMRQQAIELANRPHVVIATPGRLADHIKTSGVDTVAGLRRVKMVVLDEADRLLASGPGSMLPDVETCLGALPPSAERQTLLFTATMTAEVRALKSMPAAGNKPPIFTTEIGSHDAPRGLPARAALPEVNVTKPVIVFCNHTKTCDLLERTLRRLGHPTAARVLVATDVASRGLDIPSVELVINSMCRETRMTMCTVLVVLPVRDGVERVGRQMEEFEQEGVNIESRVVRTGLLKEVGSAKREAAGEIDEGRDILGRKRNKLKKVR